MSDLKELRERAAKIIAEANQAEGAINQAKKRLKKEFGCDNLTAAEALLQKKITELEENQKRLKGLTDALEALLDDHNA